VDNTTRGMTRGRWAANDTRGKERTIARRSGRGRLQDNNGTIGGGGGIMLCNPAADGTTNDGEGGPGGGVAF
jgi:hypothetical protein